jgi:hypothetical protein
MRSNALADRRLCHHHDDRGIRLTGQSGALSTPERTLEALQSKAPAGHDRRGGYGRGG